VQCGFMANILWGILRQLPWRPLLDTVFTVFGTSGRVASIDCGLIEHFTQYSTTTLR
jgi:hypothetical protein